MAQETAAPPSLDTCQFVLDLDGRIVAPDPRSADILGIAPARLHGRPLQVLLGELDPGWNVRLPSNLRTAASPLFLPWSRAGEPLASGVNLHLLVAGEHIYATLVPALAPPEDLDNHSLHDLPDTAASRAALFLRLRQAESRLRSYMRHLPGIFFVQRPDFSFSYISPAIERRLGVERRQLERHGSRFLELLVEADREDFQSELQRLSPSGETFSLNYRVRHPGEGNLVHFLDVRTPQLTPSGIVLGYEGVLLDTTRQAIAENRLSHTAWKESLAIITNGLIHDFSNVMAGIFSLSELYFSSLEEDHPWYRGLGQIMESSKQARTLVRRIISLNRETLGTLNYHNLENLIREQLDLIRTILRKDAEIRTEFTESELPVYLDDVAFRQTLLNLAMNARDAFTGKGRLTLRVETVAQGGTLCEDAFGGAWTAPRDGALITIADNGSGIRPDHIGRVFDPFFTTKEALKGSGFGLYNARLFAQKAGGHIDIASQPGEGTQVLLYLPLADFTETEQHEGSRAPLKHGRLALFSTEDPESHDLTANLRDNGWELIHFTRADALLRYLREAVVPPHAVLLTAIGEDPSTLQLLPLLRDEFPQLRRALFVQGRDHEELPAPIRQAVHCLLNDSRSSQENLKLLGDLVD